MSQAKPSTNTHDHSEAVLVASVLGSRIGPCTVALDQVDVPLRCFRQWPDVWTQHTPLQSSLAACKGGDVSQSFER
jgi:hypothetical protein